MKKLQSLVIICSVLFSVNQLKAQAFDDGKNLISVGFGFPATSYITETLPDYQNDQNYDYKNYGTIVLKYEHGFMKYFGVGLNLEYSAATVSYDYQQARVFNTDTTYTQNIKSSVIGGYLRLNGHYPIGDHLDIYAGFGLGYLYQINNYSSTDPNANNKSGTNSKTQSLQFESQFTLGVRYMIKPHFGLFGEVGWASTNVNMGITFGF
jgi:hypothetical protein